MSFEKQTNLFHVDSKPSSTGTKTLGPEELRGNPFFSLACGNYGLKDQHPILELEPGICRFHVRFEEKTMIFQPWNMLKHTETRACDAQRQTG